MLILKNTSSQRRFGVVVRFGENLSTSHHKNWLADSTARTWDIIASYYHQSIPDKNFDKIVYQPGHKWPAIGNLFKMSLLDNYDYVWCPDYDILTTTNDINNLFACCQLFDLQLAQPALSHDSYISHTITRQDTACILRYTRFVEMMMPVFSKSALNKCANSMENCQIGWGLDHVWPKLLNYPQHGIAIIDKIVMKHTQPVAGNYNVTEALHEKSCLFEKYGVGEDWTVSYKLTQHTESDKNNI